MTNLGSPIRRPLRPISLQRIRVDAGAVRSNLKSRAGRRTPPSKLPSSDHFLCAGFQRSSPPEIAAGSRPVRVGDARDDKERAAAKSLAAQWGSERVRDLCLSNACGRLRTFL